MNKNQLIFQKQSDDFIYKSYQQYHDFMRFEGQLPKFKINYRKATKDIFANVRYINNEYILSVDPLLCKTKFAIPTLYHEFTHIYDDIIMASLSPEISRNNAYIYHAYTEYHASQVEMMVKMGATSLWGTISNSVSSDDLFKSLLKQKEDFAHRSADLDLSLKENFSKAIDWFCYYTGKVNAYLHYYNTGSDELLDLFEFVHKFGNEIVKMQEVLFRCDITNIKISDIYEVADAHLAVMHKHIY